MTLTGTHKKQIHEALMSGYTTHAQLAMMVTFELNANLDRICGSGTLDEVVFRLIEWAEAQGRVNDLITGASEQNQGNPKLRELSALLDEKGVALDWVTVPAGEFLMGSSKAVDPLAEEHEISQRHVYMATYRITRIPVTNAQYKRFIDEYGYGPPPHWNRGEFPAGKEDHPVVNVSWHDALTFCDWAGVHLPTEAEWEKAARGSDGRIYPWGNEPPSQRFCNFNEHMGEPCATGQHPAGNSYYGCADMAGNVWEWTADWYAEDAYAQSAVRNPVGPHGGQYRVLRGGSFFNKANELRCAARSRNVADYRGHDVGIRVVSQRAT